MTILFDKRKCSEPFDKRIGPELTHEQKKAYRRCRERVKKVLEKYRDQGLITYSKDTKHTFFHPIYTWPYREFEIRGRVCMDTKYNKYFGFRFSMESGVAYKWGILSDLLETHFFYPSDQKRFEELVPDREEWKKIAEKFLEEIEKETIASRLCWQEDEPF